MKNNFNRLHLLLVIFLCCLFFLITANAFNYGFWRHDAWGYSLHEWGEFKDNGRWLAPLFFDRLHFIPHFVAWLLSMAGLYYFTYSVANRLLEGVNISKWMIASLPFIVITSPGLIGQLGWPLHSLAAVIILAIGAYLTSKKASYYVMLFTTVCVFGVLQSFSFLALLLAIPSFNSIKENGHHYILKKFALILVCWAGAIALGRLINRSLQYLVFQEIPPIPFWRQPHIAEDIPTLLENIVRNMSVFADHTKYIYSSHESLLLLITAIFFIIYLVKKGSKNKAAYLVGILSTAMPLMLAMYIATVPIGTVISFRTTFNINVAVALITITFLSLLKDHLNEKKYCIFSLLLFSFVFCNPYVLALNNSHFFKDITSDMKNTIAELSGRKLNFAKTIYVSIETDNLWKLDYQYALFGKYQIIEGFGAGMRMYRLFNELGYHGYVFWCQKNPAGSYDDKNCQILENRSFDQCSTINTDYCASTPDKDRNWFLQAK